MKNAYTIRNYFNRTTEESRTKYTILSLTLLAGVTFIVWAFSTLAYMVSVIDLI